MTVPSAFSGRKTAAILLSRQPMRPTLNDAWVHRSVEAVQWLKDNQFILTGSVGMQTWELVLSLASMHRLPAWLYLPGLECTNTDNARRVIADDFNLQEAQINIIDLRTSGESAGKEGNLTARDERVVDEANILIPISIRPDGHMARLIEKARGGGKTAVDQFRIPYKPRTRPLAYDLSGSVLNVRINDIASGYIIHWTRSSNSKWPLERSIDYYRSIVTSYSYLHSAFNTLQNIVNTQTIRASSRHIPGGIATVSFSDLPPIDVVPLMRWRTRYRQMSFEPYGIGIEQQTALDYGIRPVSYYDRATGIVSSGDDTWLSQSIGTKGDWTAEREFRHRGDFSLGSIPRGKLLLFCHTAREADRIEKETGIRAISFTL